MAEHGPQLPPVGEKSLPAKCKPRALAYCPTMDLIALATEDEELRIFRLNGQRVFGGSFGGDPYLGEDEEDGEIRALAWKGNGRLLAVACGDGTLRPGTAFSQGNVSGLGVNFTDSHAAERHLRDSAGQLSIEDLLSSSVHSSKAAALIKADLPRELALMDIESSLPKLSTLPATGSEDDLFSSRASIDAIFHSSTKDTSDSVNVLFVGYDDGSVHLRIFDCFEIGSFPIADSAGQPGSCNILRHASHPLSSTHALLAASASSLNLVTLDLRFITRSGRYLSLLASKTTQLQNLLRYIDQVQRQIELEWKNTQELPSRFLRSVNEDLQEKCHCDFITAAYHLVVTGHCFEPMKEFLVDIVGERGHKRWDKAVAGGYENIRRLTHECLLPALERSQVLLSRLIGLSKFHKLSDVLGLETTKLNAIVETLDCLHLMAHQIITHSNEELAEFLAFSRWLQLEIHILNSEALSQTQEELLEKRDLLDVPPTVHYITGALTKSQLRNFIRQLPMIGVAKPPPPGTDKWLPDGHDHSFYDTFKSLLQQQRQSRGEGGDDTAVDAPKLNDLTRRLGTQFEIVFGEIALTQRRGILHRSPLELHSDCDQSVADLTICHEDAEEGHPCSTYIAARSSTSKHLIYIYRVVLDSINGVSSTRRTAIAALSLQQGEIRQLQFVDDDTLMVLWASGEGPSYLLNFPIQPLSLQSHAGEESDPQSLAISYVDCDSTASTPKPSVKPTLLDLSSLSSPHAGIIKHAFPASGPKSRPVYLDVNGRKDRRAVCVLYGDAMRYEVLDLESELVLEEEEAEEEGEEGEGSSVAMEDEDGIDR
ncbi:Anaphase-promoting complex subunit 4 [Penicillium riverlandense]|uniref:Anaphase-promoting complex subunit 4 n=1 Tax=Penicillium riverlandense TaxID=1903569 RepID=UPI00254787B0|nr:Anaphase-promoting complex subunit 4 [Penicillium riverlandense]KAJ5819217.1 Anaphase-promoting complex subunit 4 [Penicillium riverlandense]